MRKIKVLSILMLIFVLLSGYSSAFAFSYNPHFEQYVKEYEYPEKYKEWLDNPDKTLVTQPRSYVPEFEEFTSSNPMNWAVTVASTYPEKFNLTDYTSKNVVVRDQGKTPFCWAFASIGTLEATMGYADYLNNENSSIAYDFSERHMVYASQKGIKDNKTTERTFDVTLDFGGNAFMSRAYLTNGAGAVKEKDMPFVDNTDLIDISELDKEVVTQVKDTKEFHSTNDGTKVEVCIAEIKEHLMKYGAVEAAVHGAEIVSDCYDNDSGAIYVENENDFPANHDVVIVGWDDNYSKDNFNENHVPKNNGAWIIKNSWGKEVEYTMKEMKEHIYNSVKDIAASKYQWYSANDVPDSVCLEFFKELGFDIRNNSAFLSIGKDGFMFVSYEDKNIYTSLSGFEKITEKDYDNIYQYDYLGLNYMLPLTLQDIYISAQYDRDQSKEEVLNEVSFYAVQPERCTVYVNSQSADLEVNKLKKVDLAAGSYEKVEPGYHTLEFAEPVKLNGDGFAVVIKLEGSNTDGNAIGVNVPIADTQYKNVKVYDGLTNWSYEEAFQHDSWMPISKSSTLNPSIKDGNGTIKAFTSSPKKETTKEISEIKVVTKPNKTSYKEGEDFDSTGMVVKVYYKNGTSEAITNYEIVDGKSLTKDTKSVKIRYKEFETTVDITVTAQGSNTSTTDEAESSILTSAKLSIKNGKAYFYSNSSKKTVMKMDAVVSNIIQSTKNDELKYYYYISSKSNESTINNWVEITEKQDSNKIAFTIDTTKINNFAEVSTSDKVYLYVKEVAKKGTDKKEVVTKAMEIKTDDFEIYYDDVKKTTITEQGQTNNSNNNQSVNTNNNNNNSSNNNNNNNKPATTSTPANQVKAETKKTVDNTTATSKLPNTGVKSIITISIITMIGTSLYIYRKYRNLGF